MSRTLVFPGWFTPSPKWFAVKIPAVVRAGLEEFAQVWDSPAERLHVIRAWSESEGWHLSISHPSRYPTWDEIRDARYDLLPDGCTMAMLLPPKGEYVNLHRNCFHLHEIKE